MFCTTREPDKFNLHDSVVDQIEASQGTIRIVLRFGFISSAHPDNPHPGAQCIKPCEVTFSDVHDEVVQVWSEVDRRFEPHPEPESPIRDEIIDYEVSQTMRGFVVKLSGYHDAGWTEWEFACAQVSFSWSEFTGQAWFQKEASTKGAES